ncbi:MAG: STAS domain-containing protein [Ignavibacteriaceae bacterium]|nr:STAS domain-containing protein [Ignavibacteriaceae bacterium]
MEVKTNETDTGVVIKLEGEMMLGYSANDFHEAIENAIEKNKKKIVVDLSDVRFISSWGIGILMYGYTTTNNYGGKFRLAAVSEKINEVLKKIKIDNVFEKFDTVEEALKN